MGILLACIYKCYGHVVPMEASRGHWSPPGIGVIDSCEPPSGYWEPDPGVTNALNLSAMSPVPVP